MIIGDKARDALNKEKVRDAAHFLRGELAKQGSEAIDSMMDAVGEGPNWCAVVHFTWGMSIRNLLRTNGFGEKDLGIKNLDDAYIPIIEFVVMTMKQSYPYFAAMASSLLINTVSRAVESAERFYRLQDLGEIHYPKEKA